MLCRPNNRPTVSLDIDATVCWFSEQSSLAVGNRYLIRHTSRSVTASVEVLEYRLDINTLHRDESANRLELNEIGRIRLRAQQPLMFDPYRRNRSTGGFILVDPTTKSTVAAGMILGGDQPSLASNVTWHATAVERDQRGALGATVWLTGLPGSGKSTVAVEVERRLVEAGRAAYLLDGDNLRHGLNADLDSRTLRGRKTCGELARLPGSSPMPDSLPWSRSSLLSGLTAIEYATTIGRLGSVFWKFLSTPLGRCVKRATPRDSSPRLALANYPALREWMAPMSRLTHQTSCFVRATEARPPWRTLSLDSWS